VGLGEFCCVVSSGGKLLCCEFRRVLWRLEEGWHLRATVL